MVSVRHPTNDGDEHEMLNACIEDLLDMRTYTLSQVDAVSSTAGNKARVALHCSLICPISGVVCVMFNPPYSLSVHTSVK